MLVLSSKDLAHYYRDLRKLKGLSQSKVGDEVSIRQDTVSAFELKPETSRVETLFQLLSALDLEMHIVPKGTTSLKKSETDSWSEKW